MTDQNSTPEVSGPVAAQLAELSRGTHEILTRPDLIRKLTRGKPLIVKAGFDPTRCGSSSSSATKWCS
jgi:hypothetical protein